MTDLETMLGLVRALDENQHRYSRLDAYYRGDSPLAFMSPESKKLLGNRLDRLSVGIPRLAVDAIAERLRITGFGGADIWADWLRCDLDQTSTLLHREALTIGSAYAIVWADSQGRPVVSVESATQVLTVHDPATRETIRAVKRWETATTTEATVFEADKITRWSANHKGAVGGFRHVNTIANPLGIVPVVKFANSSRLLDGGESEMAAVLDLTDAVNKLTVDMLVASETSARPRRWAVGLELSEVPELDKNGDETGEMVAVSPISEGDRLMVNESPDGKFGQLDGSNLAGYTDAIGQLMRQVSAVSGLPEHMLGIGGDNPTSADSIRASEAALTAKAEARQAVFGRSWESVGRLVAAVRDGIDPDTVAAVVQWADPATRSIAQEADALVKLYAAGLLPQQYALRKLGYGDDEILAIRAATRTEALDRAGAAVLAEVTA